MNLNKDVSSWGAVKADAVMTMSPAAQINVLTMALDDIQRLGANVDRLASIETAAKWVWESRGRPADNAAAMASLERAIAAQK